jgi:hypothetical protein
MTLRCSACKKEIGPAAMHWVCSVSTCNRPSTDYKFCSVACWDSHLGTLRHRDAWAVEVTPGSNEGRAPDRVPEQRSAAPAAATSVAPSGASPAPIHLEAADREILIVVSKLKKYIRDRSGMNTSDSVAEALSDHVRALCDASIRTAAAEGRKTVLDRDVPRLSR